VYLLIYGFKKPKNLGCPLDWRFQKKSKHPVKDPTLGFFVGFFLENRRFFENFPKSQNRGFFQFHKN
jgi:hypothetical protein